MATITLSKPPKNSTVVAVICNVTISGFNTAKSYDWDPSETFGYKLHVIGAGPAATNVKYFGPLQTPTAGPTRHLRCIADNEIAQRKIVETFRQRRRCMIRGRL